MTPPPQRSRPNLTDFLVAIAAGRWNGYPALFCRALDADLVQINMDTGRYRLTPAGTAYLTERGLA